MNVSTGKKISIEYTVTVEDGKTIDSNVGHDPLIYTHGRGEIVPGLEKALEGLAVGDTKVVTVSPADGYGEIDDSAFIEVEKEKVPDDAHQVGVHLVARDESGVEVHPKVTEIKDDTIVLDFNHPLAGKTLNFDVKILEIDMGEVQ